MTDSREDGFLRTAKDLFSGAMGGVAQVLLGQPFDIVKVRLQTSAHSSSAVQVATSIWKKEGPLAFYKGTLTPLIGVGACVSIQFGAFHETRRYLERYNAQNFQTKKDLTLGQYFIAGATAGVANSVISGPIEHIRIRLQTQPHGDARLYKGPLDCIRKIAAQDGIWKGIYRGEAVTILREAQAYGLWFLTFEYLMGLETRDKKREDVSPIKIAFYGGIAGEVLWLGSYPLDVVKSKMQSDKFGKEQRYSTMRDCFKQTWKSEGLRGFWKGIGPTLVRAMPVSAGTFAVAELTLRLIN